MWMDCSYNVFLIIYYDLSSNGWNKPKAVRRGYLTVNLTKLYTRSVICWNNNYGFFIKYFMVCINEECLSFSKILCKGMGIFT